MTAISIIVPTLNEEKYIGTLLSSLHKQTFKNFEVIIVDCKSTDKTVKEVKKFSKKLNLKIIFAKKGIGNQRNKGAKKAKSDLLLFLDADVKLNKNFIKKTIREFKKNKLKTATCYMKPISKHPIDFLLFKLCANLIIRATQFHRPIAPGACIFCKRKIFNKLKGFNTKIKLAEDVEFVQRAAKKGKFRAINEEFNFSIRRLHKEGRHVFLMKYIYAGLLNSLNRYVKKNSKIRYDFGKH